MTATHPTVANVGRDYRFWLALAGALPVWAALYLGSRPTSDFTWPVRAPMLFVQLALLYPILEEMIFRGVIQTAGHRYLPARWFGPISLSNLATSLMFTVMHFLYHPPLWAGLVIIPSLVFGYFKDKHGSLSGPVILHIFYNAGYYLIFGPALQNASR